MPKWFAISEALCAEEMQNANTLLSYFVSLAIGTYSMASTGVAIPIS